MWLLALKQMPIPQDGKVYRLKSNAKFDALGYTAKHPRGAFALKEQVCWCGDHAVGCSMAVG